MGNTLIFTATFIILLQLTRSHVIVYRTFTNQLMEEFYDLPAEFGPSLPSNGLRVYAKVSKPRDACKVPLPPGTDNFTDPLPQQKYVLVVARSNCTFETKVQNAQIAGYDAVIVYNIGSDELEKMSAKDGSGIKIPSVFVGETSGLYIIESYLYDSGFTLVLTGDLPFDINKHLIIPFSILVGLCFIIMVVYMIYKCVREQRRLRQYRLPKKLLKKIPTRKFTKGDPYETCVICIEDFAEGDKLRILPCSHAYHCDCIDTWLTKNRRVCPICKRKVFARGESRRSRRRNISSDSMSDSETDDTTPLLNPVENANNHGTFSRNDVESRPAENENSNSSNTDTIVNENQDSNRINPFDRVPNLPPHLLEERQTNRRSILDLPFFRLFKRRQRSSEDLLPHLEANEEISHEIEQPVINNQEQYSSTPQSTSITVNLPSRSASNNLLNTNLSGSFKESDDENNGRTIYEPIGSSDSTANQNNDNNVNNDLNINDSNNELSPSGRRNSDSIFIRPPSYGGIGVAALPNTNFSNNQTNNNNNNQNLQDNSRHGHDHSIV